MSEKTLCLKCSSPARSVFMEEVLTRRGVLIDVCPSCQGVWLDQGELNFFVKDRRILNQYEMKGLEDARPASEKCPKCPPSPAAGAADASPDGAASASPPRVRVGRLPGFPHQTEECPQCRGLFFDAHEFKKLENTGAFRGLRRDRSFRRASQILKKSDRSKEREPVFSQAPPASASLRSRQTGLRETGRPARSSSGPSSLPSRQAANAPGAAAPSAVPSAAPTAVSSAVSRAGGALANFRFRLGFTTAAVLFSMYGLLFAGLVFLMEAVDLPLAAGAAAALACIALQFYFGPIFMDWQLKWCGSLSWKDPSELPPAFQKSLFRLCRENRLPLPKMGIVNDGSPAAYTYGRTPRSARVVFSRGMFELLDEDETEAVLAHELGHIKHWDFAIMTVLQIVPLLLYIIYSNVKEALQQSKGSSNNKDKAPLVAALIVSYVFYLISEYLVLFVSRVREYAADRFSCLASQKPNSLLTALVKISYGLLHSAGEASFEESEGLEESDSRHDADSQNSPRQKKPRRGRRGREGKLKTLESLNIMSVARSKQMALASQGENFSPAAVREIMKWDLWNPWAFYYELNSTHPLTAKRIQAVSQSARAMGQEPFLSFDEEKPESYWDDFFFDLIVLSLPFILGIAGVLAGMQIFGGASGGEFLEAGESLKHSLKAAWSGGESAENTGFFEKIKTLFFSGGAGKAAVCLGLFGFFLGALIRTLKAYPSGRFLSHSVASLLKLIKVSPVRSRPVTLKGRIIGRGEAGNIFSEDFVLKDRTGLIYLNHEPFGLNIFFALFRYKKFRGKDVKVRGWYRRSPSPYIEVREIRSKETKSRSYIYDYKLAACLLGLGVSLILFF